MKMVNVSVVSAKMMHKEKVRNFGKLLQQWLEIKEKVKEQHMTRQSTMQLDYVPNQLQNKWFKNLTRKE